MLWIDPARLAPNERNLARMTLLDPRMRQLWVEWEQLAREAVGHLRAATAMFPGDARLTNLVGELLVLSPEFALWWMEHDVALQRSRRKRFCHPEEGELAFYNESMEMVGEGLLFMVYLPVDVRTRDVCTRLAARSSLGGPGTVPVDRTLRVLPGRSAALIEAASSSGISTSA